MRVNSCRIKYGGLSLNGNTFLLLFNYVYFDGDSEREQGEIRERLIVLYRKCYKLLVNEIRVSEAKQARETNHLSCLHDEIYNISKMNNYLTEQRLVCGLYS